MAIDVETSGAQPKKVTVDGNTAEQHSIADQILADNYTKSQAAAASAKKGFAITPMKASGS